MARIKMVVNGNEFEAEGDEAFLKSLYEDFKTALASVNRIQAGSPDNKVQSGQIERLGNGTVEKQAPPSGKKQQAQRKKRSKSVAADRKLNLRPDGKQSFADFVVKTRPATNNERNVVSVYYLTQVLQRPSTSLAQIVSCYDDRNWRVPADIKNSLQQTASTHGWINTESSDEIVLEVKGINHVKHDMPSKKMEA